MPTLPGDQKNLYLELHMPLFPPLAVPAHRIFDRNTIKLLRLPFSLFLFPIFCFAVSQADTIHWGNTIIAFIALHFFIYPASNGYNSYMDRDKGSIGGLKAPPPVTTNLYYASMLIDGIGLLISLQVGFVFMLMMLGYILVSKAYSWHGIRLKKMAITGWAVVIIFQGAYTFMMVNMCCENAFDMHWWSLKNGLSMAIASLLLGGFYPLTQIYQHEEDSERGDYTISYRLGVIGTFIFTATLFLMANAIAYYYFTNYYTLAHFELFNLCLLPVTLYFLYWFVVALRDRSKADFSHAMRMTLISSFSMIVCFSVLFWRNHG
jgi:1,4-dihydroxy-2-naphthoate octaprenyltransferase